MLRFPALQPTPPIVFEKLNLFTPPISATKIAVSTGNFKDRLIAGARATLCAT